MKGKGFRVQPEAKDVMHCTNLAWVFSNGLVISTSADIAGTGVGFSRLFRSLSRIRPSDRRCAFPPLAAQEFRMAAYPTGSKSQPTRDMEVVDGMTLLAQF
jgi:amino acid transporter